MTLATEITQQTDVQRIVDAATWDRLVDDCGGHPLQSWGWGELKAGEHWSVLRLAVHRDGVPIGGAQVLQRRLPGPLRPMLYIPRGPFAVPGRWQEVVAEIADYCRTVVPATLLTVEPDQVSGPEGPGWRRTSNTILIPRTLILDLSRPEAELLGAMAKKTRQYIRKSAREGLEIRRVTSPDELDDCLAIYHETADRAGFALHGDDYYRAVVARLGARSRLYAAYDDGQPVAFLWLAASRQTAFELYGGVSPRGQKLRLNYGLKFYAMQQMKALGVQRYDFNGLLNDGISDFKRQFAKHEDQLIGTWDKPLSPLYAPFNKTLPLVRKTAKTYLPQAKSQVSATISKLRRK